MVFNCKVKELIKKLKYVEIGRNGKFYDPKMMDENRYEEVFFLSNNNKLK